MGEKQRKSPATPERIYKIMLYMTFAVGGIFFVKNLLGKSFQGAAVVGLSLLVFALVVFFMKKKQVPMVKQQLAVSISLVFLVFIISLNTGSFYSDDFGLFLAVLALSGMYLQPSYPIYQAVLSTILLIVLYVLHPEKADPLSQYIMCIFIFDAGAFVMYMLIKRGRAFIELGNARAEEAEKLIASMKHISEELNTNYEQSSERISGMAEVNNNLAENVAGLKKGSTEISEGTKVADEACTSAMEQVQITENQIEALNEEIRKVEDALGENKANMQAMTTQMQRVKKEVGEVNTVFTLLQQQIAEIAGVTEQLTSIASSTKMLALNASIEAARAGQSGAGFAVVASKVQDLAVDSSKCSDQVVSIVEKMQEQIIQTTKELEESMETVEVSITTLAGLEKGFGDLTNQFSSLYGNIEEQNKNIRNVDRIFDKLRERVEEMSVYAEENQTAVEAIVDVTDAYRGYVDRIVEDTKQIHELSSSMLDTVE